jgi:hypothetical protein
VTARTQFVLEMTDHQRIAALTRLGTLHPEIFDDVVLGDTERQRAIRAIREQRAAAREDGSDD